MITPAILFLALLLDALIGEPRALWSRVPHPAVLMGRAVGGLDHILNSGTNRRLKGVLALLILVVGAGVLGWGLSLFGWALELVVAAILLAQRSLIEHVQAVANGLRLSLGEGRQAVAQIVGRDTGTMSEADVARAAIESAAENFADGVIAPAFWFLIGGLPGLLIYKVVNTADSMIGYITPKHTAFGWAAARFDDLLNLIPARLSAVLIAATHGGFPHWREIVANARIHRSPNAGWPEAAMALALNTSLAGPRSYEGEMRDFPFVHESGDRTPDARTIERANAALWRAWAAASGTLLLIVLMAYLSR